MPGTEAFVNQFVAGLPSLAASLPVAVPSLERLLNAAKHYTRLRESTHLEPTSLPKQEKVFIPFSPPINRTLAKLTRGTAAQTRRAAMTTGYQ